MPRAPQEPTLMGVGPVDNVQPVSNANPFPVGIATASSVVPMSLQTNATGTTYTAFAAQPCKQLDVINVSGTTIEYQRDGAGVSIPIPSPGGRLIVGIVNANQIAVRRADVANTQVTIKAEALN